MYDMRAGLLHVCYMRGVMGGLGGLEGLEGLEWLEGLGGLGEILGSKRKALPPKPYALNLVFVNVHIPPYIAKI